MSERNVVVLRGALAAEPRTRELPSGSVLTQLDVTTRDAGGTQSVPVAWFDPPAAAAELVAGDELVVIGSVRRRFFRAGGATQSRTEVVAEKVLPARRARVVARALEAVCRTLQAPPEVVEEVAVAASG
jgi:single-strand DNA-binding protein